MSFTKRQKIVSVIIDSLKLIKPDGGFQSGLGDKIEDWQTDWQEDELTDTPGTSVCDLIATRDAENSDDFQDCFQLPIQIRTSFSSAVRAETARKYIADILQALKPLKDGFGVNDQILANKVDLIREGFVLADDGFRVAATAVEIEVLYFTERFNAYE